MKTKFKTRIMIEALILCFVLMAIFLMTPFVNRVQYTYADENYFADVLDDYDPYDYFGMDGEELSQFVDSHLSNNEVEDNFIDEVDSQTSEYLLPYIYFEGRYLYFDVDSFYNDFAGEYYTAEDLIYNYLYGWDYSDLSEEEKYQLFESRGITEEDYTFKLKLSAALQIQRNINLMNELVNEDAGYIDSDFEFVFFDSDEYIELWRAWGFKLSWNKFTVNFDKDFAIILGMIVLVYHTITLSKDLSLALSQLESASKIDEIIKLCGIKLPGEIASGILGLFTSPVISTLLTFVSVAKDILSSASVLTKVINILLDLLMPSVVDGVLVVYNAVYFNKGVYLKLCWIPTWWDSWGLSISSI